MTILAGGAWCDGAFASSMQSDSPTSPTTQLNQYLRLVPDPLGRPYLVLRADCFQSVYAALATSGALRAEASVQSSIEAWGATYAHHWRLIFPGDLPSLGVGQSYTVAQMHDVNAPGVGRRPTLAADVEDDVMSWVLSTTASPTGTVVYSRPIVRGMEIDFTLRARWADGTNEPDANGVFELYERDALVYQSNGTRNTWDNGTPPEPNPPYLKAGVYQPDFGEGWWAGRGLWMYHVASIVATGDETPTSLRRYVDSRLTANTSAPRAVYVRP